LVLIITKHFSNITEWLIDCFLAVIHHHLKRVQEEQ
jgi:hypothetical protein